MATDRERAEELFDQIARDLGDRRGIPDIRYDFDEEAHADIRAAIIPMIERALAPTDAERDAHARLEGAVRRFMGNVSREVLDEKTKTARENGEDDIHVYITVEAVEALSRIAAALARLDAATGGRGDG